MRFKIFSSNIVIFTMLCTSLYGADSATALTESSSFPQSKPDVKQQIASHTLEKLWGNPWDGMSFDTPTQGIYAGVNEKAREYHDLSVMTALLHTYRLLGRVPELRLSEKTTINMENSDKELRKEAIERLRDFREFYTSSSTTKQVPPSLDFLLVAKHLPALQKALTSATATTIPHCFALFANPYKQRKTKISIFSAADISEPAHTGSLMLTQKGFFPLKLSTFSEVIICFGSQHYHPFFADHTLNVAVKNDKEKKEGTYQYTLACILATDKNQEPTLLIPTMYKTCFYGWRQQKKDHHIHAMKYAGVYSFKHDLEGYCTTKRDSEGYSTDVIDAETACGADTLIYILPPQSEELTDSAIAQAPAIYRPKQDLD